MANYILGGGLVALLAKEIFPDWQIFPVGKSRFYQYNPPLADNFVVRDESIDEYMRNHTIIPYLYKNAYSFGSQLLFNTNIPLGPYLQKLYGGQIPPHAAKYWANQQIGDNMAFGKIADAIRKAELQDVDTRGKTSFFLSADGGVARLNMTANLQFLEKYGDLVEGLYA